MTGEVPKKRMSKGCLIALIVVGVLLLLVIIAGITCYLKKDELVKYGTTAMVTSIKTDLNENPVAGVDTVRVNAITDAFIEKLNESEVDYDKYGHFGQTLQAFQSDEEIDSAEAEQFVQAMIEYFPELEDLVAPITVRPTIEKSSWEAVDTIEVREQVIYKGLHADTVFNVLKKSDAISDPDIRNDGYGNLIVTHHWKVDERYIDITFERWNDMYRVKEIKVLENKQPTLGED